MPRWLPSARPDDTVRMGRRQEHLAHAVRTLAASLLVGDDTVFLEFLSWLAHLLACRGVPATVLASALDALGPGVGQVNHEAVLLLATGQDLLVAKDTRLGWSQRAVRR